MLTDEEKNMLTAAYSLGITPGGDVGLNMASDAEIVALIFTAQVATIESVMRDLKDIPLRLALKTRAQHMQSRIEELLA